MKNYLKLPHTPTNNTAISEGHSNNRGRSRSNRTNTLKKKMGFSSCSRIGWLVYPMVCCWPNLSFATVKLSQYNLGPAKIHFDRVRHALKYLYQTQTEGLYYWRTNPQLELESKPLPAVWALSTIYSRTSNNATNPSQLLAWAMQIGHLVHAPNNPSQAYSFIWQVLQWLKKLNCRILLPHCLWNLNLWLHTTLQKCYYIFAASCETSMFFKKPPVSMKTMMHVQQWQTCRNQQHVLDTWISATMSSVNGSNKT